LEQYQELNHFQRALRKKWNSIESEGRNKERLSEPEGVKEKVVSQTKEKNSTKNG
jgi:hypothetical protein